MVCSDVQYFVKLCIGFFICALVSSYVPGCVQMGQNVPHSQTLKNCSGKIDHDRNVLKAYIKSFCLCEPENVNEWVL